MDFVVELVVGGILVGVLYALVGLGFVLVYRVSGVVHLALGECVMLGGFVAASLQGDHGWPLPLAVAAAMVALAVVSAGIERIAIPPGRRTFAMLMATLGAGLVLRSAAALVWGGRTLNLALPLAMEPLAVGPLRIHRVPLVAAAVGIVVLVALELVLRAPVGVRLRALASDPQMAAAFGVRVRRYVSATWAVSGVISVVAGVLWGNMIGVDIQSSSLGLRILPMVILGGLTSVTGAVVAGIAIGVAEALTSAYIDPLVGGGTKEIIPYVGMLIVLALRPQGLFGERSVERV